MAERVSLSKENVGFELVAEFHSDAVNSIRYYYSSPSLGLLDPKFLGYTVEELNYEREEHLATLDQVSAFSVLAAIEARFRIDFHLRCSKQLKDDLSRHFKGLQKAKGTWISLEEDILDGWRSHCPPCKSLISDLKGALNYRHWFAHGHYYNPKLGKKYDFFSVYYLAERIGKELSLRENSA